MGRYAPPERIFLIASFTVICSVAAFGVFTALNRRAPSPPELETVEPRPEVTPPRPPPAPPPKPHPPISLRGRIVDLPGFSIPPGVLGHTRVALLRDGLPLGEEVIPEDDGTFLLERSTSPHGLVLRVSTLIRVNQFRGTLDRPVTRDQPLKSPGPDLGDIPLPRPADLGRVEFRVVDAAGAIIHPEWVGLEAVAGTSTPDLGIARLDELDVAANAPVEYRRGGRGTILYVPPGEYWLRAAALNRLMPSVKVRVGSVPVVATIAERVSDRRIRGIVRERGAGWPLEDVWISITPAHPEEAASREAVRVGGRTSRTGAYDLPIWDPLPAGGLRISFTRPGYGGSDLIARTADFKGGKTLVLDLDLGRD